LDSIELTAQAEGLSRQFRAARGSAAIDIVAQRVFDLQRRTKDAQAKQPGSIHRRGRMGDGRYTNTCAKKDKDVTRRKIAAIKAHVERTGDRVPMTYLNKLQASL
jgi:hypothetical protein